MPRQTSKEHSMNTRMKISRVAYVAMLAGLVAANSAYATTHQISSGSKTSGSGASYSEEYLISYSAPAGEKIKSHSLQLVGDRRCGAWATCRVITATDTLVVYGFSLQGHNEGGFLYINNPNSGQRDSTALLTVETN
jgi:hypothetical protein